MNVTCPDCRTVYRVDPRKIPSGGVVARCARCSAEFAVESETDALPSPLTGESYVAAYATKAAVEPARGDRSDGHQAEADAVSESVAESRQEPVTSDWSEPPVTGAIVPENGKEVGDWLSQVSSRLEAEPQVEQETWVSASSGSAEDATPEDLKAAERPAAEEEGRISVTSDYSPSENDVEPVGLSGDVAAQEYEEQAVTELASSAQAPGDTPSAEGREYAAVPAADDHVVDASVSYRPAAEPEVHRDEPVLPAAEDDRSSIILVGAMPAPPREEPVAAEPWAAGAGKTTEPAPEGGPGMAREREEVFVSANAGALDGVAGVSSSSGAGEGFTSVPSRTDHEMPLPPAPFGSADPHARAQRLARALVSDIVVYNPDRRDRSIRMGTVRQEFRDEIRKSWEEYVSHVGNQMARDTSYFRDALNELLAGGNRLF